MFTPHVGYIKRVIGILMIPFVEQLCFMNDMDYHNGILTRKNLLIMMLVVEVGLHVY